MYLQQLAARLSDGLSRAPADFRHRHTDYLKAAQNPDGGFSGREGGSDLYYTGFALRGLAALGELSLDIAERAADYLRPRLRESASVVDFYSLLYSCAVVQASGGPDVLADSPADWPDRVSAALETFRTSDGGYAKATDAVAGSTYHTFLVGLCYQLLGRGFPDPEGVLAFVESRRREDGGYVELRPMRRSGANPTAAAVGVVQMVRGDSFHPAELAHVAEFLAGLRSVEGGLCANGRIPIADVLSTFTGAWTLEQLGALDRLDAREALAFAHAAEGGEGGFRGVLWDEGRDVEYTFYGLGIVGLLTP